MRKNRPDPPATSPDTPYRPPSSLLGQVLRFAVVGVLATIIDAGLYAVLIIFGLPLAASKSLSFIAGTTAAYLLNRRWTFAASPSRARFIAVVALYAVTFVAQVGINSAVAASLHHNLWWRLPLAFVVAQSIATCVNFIVQRLIIFKIR